LPDRAGRRLPDGRTAVVVAGAVAAVELIRRSQRRATYDAVEQQRVERQKAVIADLGRRALESTDPVALMNDAVLAVGDVLGAPAASSPAGWPTARSAGSRPTTASLTTRFRPASPRRPCTR
jgi:hypothetical protein